MYIGNKVFDLHIFLLPSSWTKYLKYKSNPLLFCFWFVCFYKTLQLQHLFVVPSSTPPRPREEVPTNPFLRECPLTVTLSLYPLQSLTSCTDRPFLVRRGTVSRLLPVLVFIFIHKVSSLSFYVRYLRFWSFSFGSLYRPPFRRVRPHHSVFTGLSCTIGVILLELTV